MDNLEKFIKQNREGMDREVPDLKVWAAIDKNLSAVEPEQKAKVVPLFRRLRAAAAILLLLTAGGLGGSYFATQTSGNEINSLADISPEHAETERWFNRQVDEKVAKLASYKQAENVKPDLEQLDAVFQELAAELEKAPKGKEEQIINAMITNYQAKVDILNRVLEKVETANQKNEEEDEISL